MRRPAALVALLVVSLPLVGCATFALNMAPDRPGAPWNPATTTEGEIIAGVPPPPDQLGNGSYVLPSNANLAGGPMELSSLANLAGRPIELGPRANLARRASRA